MNIDQLLTKYVDGEITDTEELLKLCPFEDREELEGLINMINIFSRNVIQPKSSSQAQINQLFEHLDEIRIRTNESNTKLTANFRKDDHLCDDEKEGLKDILQKIIDEEFGED